MVLPHLTFFAAYEDKQKIFDQKNKEFVNKTAAADILAKVPWLTHHRPLCHFDRQLINSSSERGS